MTAPRIVCSIGRTDEPSPAWQLTQLTDWSMHCHPNFDLVSHELSPDCVCGPQVTRMHARADRDNWAYQHHSLDGRERTS